jgi:hypothetical protein
LLIRALKFNCEGMLCYLRLYEPATPQLERSPTVQAWRLKQPGWLQRRIVEALGISEGGRRSVESGFDPLTSVVWTYAPVG